MNIVFVTIEFIKKTNFICFPFYFNICSYLFALIFLFSNLNPILAKTWKQNRKFINPTMRSTVISRLTPIFNKHAKLLRNNFEKLASQQKNGIPSNILPIVGGTSFSAAIEAFVGDEMDEKTSKKLYNQLKFLIAIGGHLTASVPLNIICHEIMNRIPIHCTLLPMKLVNYLVYALDKVEKSFKIKGNSNVMSNGEEIKPKHTMFMKRLIELKNLNLPEEYDGVNSMILFLTASTHTISLVISNLLLLLAMHPKVQEKCYEEIKSVLIDTDDEIDVDTVLNLKYLNMVLNESLRLFTPVPLIGRRTGCDLELGL